MHIHTLMHIHTPLLVPNNGRKRRFYSPAQAKPHTRGVVPNNVRTSRRRDPARATSTSTDRCESARYPPHLKDPRHPFTLTLTRTLTVTRTPTFTFTFTFRTCSPLLIPKPGIHTHTHARTRSNTHFHIHIQSVLSAADSKARSEVSFLLARTRKTTHKGNGPTTRTNLPAPGPRSARGCHIDFDRPA